MLRLFDSATRDVRELAMREPGTVSIYLCGPTVYGPPHLGHGRATLVYDVLRRYLTWSGITVRLASNIIDIDDKIIDRANREGRPWQDITHRCETVWFDAMGKLGVERPTDVPHATEYVDAIVEDVRWLGFEPHGTPVYASDYFEQLYRWAEHHIADGLAYVDDQDAETISAQRGGYGKPGVESRLNRESEIYFELVRRWRDLPKPTIAAVQGACIAGALMLA